MKKILFSILCAFMVSTMASAQYLNVKLDYGTYRSFKTSSKTEVSFGAKAGTEVMAAQPVTVGGHKVTVMLAENTPASEVVFSTNIEGDAVKIKAVSLGGYRLKCTRDDNVVVSDSEVSNGFYTFSPNLVLVIFQQIYHLFSALFLFSFGNLSFGEKKVVPLHRHCDLKSFLTDISGSSHQESPPRKQGATHYIESVQIGRRHFRYSVSLW